MTATEPTERSIPVEDALRLAIDTILAIRTPDTDQWYGEFRLERSETGAIVQWFGSSREPAGRDHRGHLPQRPVLSARRLDVAANAFGNHLLF